MSVCRPASYILVVANAIVHLHVMHVAGDLDRKYHSCNAADCAMLEDFFSSDWMLSMLGSESEPFDAAQARATTAMMDLVRLLALYDPISSLRVQFATPHAIAEEKPPLTLQPGRCWARLRAGFTTLSARGQYALRRRGKTRDRRKCFGAS
ncbi:hypothetical protein AURDEDRAFT_130583 [Auricularia subglabra TFB-10046 SS5]|nr:hypothetical protein AURDEDRAFT_130583 [Auricularia subglabra TFB-10046 SS5]